MIAEELRTKIADCRRLLRRCEEREERLYDVGLEAIEAEDAATDEDVWFVSQSLKMNDGFEARLYKDLEQLEEQLRAVDADSKQGAAV